jgi:ATP/maltotriose-dependent transcriptional regulator MalT/DNA-binding SARP family transcriptional activator
MSAIAPSNEPSVPTLGSTGGLIDFRRYNLRGNQTTAQGQELMAPANRRDATDKPSKLPAGEKLKEARPSFFLRTKLLPPRPAPELLSRARLTDRLLANLSSPMTLVTANAGSGKTTLVADFLRTHKRQFVWYQLDHTDADTSVFLGYLAFGIQQQVPGFGEALFAYLKQATGELAQHPERAVDVFLNEVLESVEQQLILVLDDYHHLGAETAVHAVVDRLLAYLPDVLHIIIVSREIPPLALGRLRTQAPLANIDRTDLLFTDSETQELFRKVFDLELTAEQLVEYRERTHGWITALQLVRQVAHRSIIASEPHQLPDLAEVLRQSERDIFDYFAEEVFSDESDEVRHLLLQISLLDRIELDTCAALCPGSNCARVLPSLVRRHVFLTVASDRRGEEYRLHPLFQDFLRRRLRSEIGRTGVANEHQRYAAYFLGRGMWEQGVRHLLAAEDFNGAASVIAEKGPEWISSGALSSLASLADVIPASSFEAFPQALAHRAEVARLRGEYEFAASMLRRAITLLQEANDTEGEANALHSLATVARRDGNCELAFSYLDRAVALTPADSPVRVKCGNTRGLCFVAMGEWTTAEREFRAALQLAEEQNDEHYVRLIAHNLGTPAGMRGDFGEALRWLGRMLRNDRQGAPMPQEAVAHLNMARCYLYRGDFSASEKHLDSALERCQLFNLVGLRAETFEAYGNLYRERREIERAVEYYERAARAYDEGGISLERTELLEERALLNLQVGDLATAQVQIDRLLSARLPERENNERLFFTASLTRARILTAYGDYQQARETLKTASEYFRKQGFYYYEAQASLALAVCDLHLGKEPEMVEGLKRAIDLAVRYDYEYWLGSQVDSYTDVFASEEALELLPPDLRERAQTPRQAAAETSPARVNEVDLPRQIVTDLKVNMLGPVEILRDPSRPLASDAWSTRRARDIFCYIVSRRHHRASKDTIIDTFWGETDFEAVEKNFHPTVSHIRKALNSNQPLKQNFLLYRDGDYQLNPEFSYQIDIEQFDALLSEGENARRARNFAECISAYEGALKLYRGEFMQGSYEPWVEEQRTYYREQYLRLLEALAGVAQTANDWPRAMQLAQQILHEDQFREDIHCLLMRGHAALGNRGAVKEQYENLKRLLFAELGVNPSPETQQLYQQLIG